MDIKKESGGCALHYLKSIDSDKIYLHNVHAKRLPLKMCVSIDLASQWPPIISLLLSSLGSFRWQFTSVECVPLQIDWIKINPPNIYCHSVSQPVKLKEKGWNVARDTNWRWPLFAVRVHRCIRSDRATIFYSCKGVQIEKKGSAIKLAIFGFSSEHKTFDR